jgi:ribosomal protein S27AE
MRSMTRRKPQAEPVEAGTGMLHVSKQRECLMCGTAFASQWSGERICGKCKSSSAWRGGVVSAPGGRRA